MLAYRITTSRRSAWPEVRPAFVKIEGGGRRINTFTLIDGWKSLDAVEAARRMALAKLPKPHVPRHLRALSPRLSWMDDGR